MAGWSWVPPIWTISILSPLQTEISFSFVDAKNLCFLQLPMVYDSSSLGLYLLGKSNFVTAPYWNVHLESVYVFQDWPDDSDRIAG